MLSWPAYKVCEPHAILIGLTGLSALAAFAPASWLALWRLGLIVMAVLAPTLAIARAWRTVARGSIEAEFARWFVPDGRPGSPD